MPRRRGLVGALESLDVCREIESHQGRVIVFLNFELADFKSLVFTFPRGICILEPILRFLNLQLPTTPALE
jgi:hypothetical protein